MINSDASGSTLLIVLYLLRTKYTQSQNCWRLVITATLCSGEHEFDSLLCYSKFVSVPLITLWDMLS
jgi:hypothetical protein